MKAAQLLAATRRTLKSTPDIQLLPPRALYRRVLRAHRVLPIDARILGDQYVKAEFRLHKDLDNPAQIVGFLSSWQHYVESIVGDRWRHEKLDMDKIARLDDQQIIQLYELMQAAKVQDSEYGDILEEPQGKASI